MPNVTSNLIATITAVDVAAKQPITRDIGSPAYAGKTGDFTVYQELPVDGTPVSITLPVSPCLCVYVKNNHSTATVKVNVTPQGGADTLITQLQPGGVCLIWNPSTSATAGITALKLTPVGAANVPVEYYIGG